MTYTADSQCLPNCSAWRVLFTICICTFSQQTRPHVLTACRVARHVAVFIVLDRMNDVPWLFFFLDESRSNQTILEVVQVGVVDNTNKHLAITA